MLKNAFQRGHSLILDHQLLSQACLAKGSVVVENIIALMPS